MHFQNFHLSPGVQVSLYRSGDSTPPVKAKYTGTGPLHSGEFWSLPVRGPLVMIELESPIYLETLPFEIHEAALTDPSEDSFESEQETKVEVRDSLYRGTAVRHLVIDGMAVWEGDIVLGRADELEPYSKGSSLRQSLVLNGPEVRWAGGNVPYVIDPTLPNRDRIRSAIDHWNARLSGHVRLLPQTTENAYVAFKPAPPSTCSSYAGRTGESGQPINIGMYCSTGNVIHEIGHAIGLLHEHTRGDRDSHVRIQPENVDPAYAFNFAKCQGASDEGPYDFDSIMHYGAYAFSANGKPTIVTIPAGISIGQRSSLSAGDIEAVRKLYPRISPVEQNSIPVSFTSSPSGIMLLADGLGIATPGSRQWPAGSHHQISAPVVTAPGEIRTFVQWSDGGAQTHDVVAAASDLHLGATCRVRYQLSAGSDDPSRGTISQSPASPDGYYDSGITVNLTATPALGYCLASWSGLLPGGGTEVSVEMTRPYTITAVFQPGDVSVPGGLAAPAAGGTYSLTVPATSGCLWNAVSHAGWIHVRNPAGAGSAVLMLEVEPNLSSDSRRGYVAVNSGVVAVSQGRE
ncbi:MAG: hypothetical protein IT165_37130 [Bryobacterales bacterium]|nr:hypothetical protein [Bryobacterales bacterium]